MTGVSCPLLRPDGNREREGRSAARLRLDGQLAAVRLDNPPRDRQPEPGAAARRVRHLHERLEDRRRGIRAECPAPVSATEIATSSPRRTAATGDRAARRRRARRIGHQIADHALDLARDPPTPAAGRAARRPRAGRPCASTCSRSGSTASRSSVAGRIGASCGVTAPDSIFDRSSSSRIRRSSRAVSSRHTCRISCCRSSSGPAGALEQQMNAHLHARQRRPQLVRRGGDELGFQPADLAEVRDVLEQRDRADQPAVGVASSASIGCGTRAGCRRRPTAAPPRHLRTRPAPATRSTSATACAMRGSRATVVDRLAERRRPARRTGARRPD